MLREVHGHPSYAYLKLKIPGPAGIITVEAKAQQALDCEKNNIELASEYFPLQLAQSCPLCPTPSRQPRMLRSCKSTPRTHPRPFKLGHA
jgi:hypothetical protein